MGSGRELSQDLASKLGAAKIGMWGGQSWPRPAFQPALREALSAATTKMGQPKVPNIGRLRATTGIREK